MGKSFFAAALIVSVIGCSTSPRGGGTGGDELVKNFQSPPAEARPWVYWFWVDGNVSREGITADLEAMQRVGIGGILLMDVTQTMPKGPVRCNSDSWQQLFQHLVAEAARLGLQVDMHNAPGWSGSGGPWVMPEFAMQQLVHSKTNFSGPGHVDMLLPKLPEIKGYSRNVVTLAFPTIVGDGAKVPGFSPK